MWESFIAAAVVVALLGLALVSALAPGFGLLATGVALVVVGLVVGIPGGVVYHVVLSRVLARRRALTPRWWLAPTALHERLRSDERRAVMPWFWAGAAGFALIVLGAVLVVASSVIHPR